MNLCKLMVVVILSALLIIALIAVTSSQSDKNPVPADAQSAVLARLAEIQNAAEALDAEKVFSYVLENDNGALAQNGRLLLTRKQALESTIQGFQGLQQITYKFDQQHVTLLSPTIALATGEGTSFVTMVDGRTFSSRFAQTVIFVLTDGEWKVFHSHRSFPAAR
jgi:ketosteroid isomerase-like protein